MAKYLPPKVSRYYKRRREYPRADDLGTSIKATLTRYAWGEGARKVTGPRGGKLYQRFYRQAHYHEGRFYRVVKVRAGDGKGLWPRALEPIEGRIWDVHPLQSEEQGIPPVSLDLVGGVPVAVTVDGERSEVGPYELPILLGLLGLESVAAAA